MSFTRAKTGITKEITSAQTASSTAAITVQRPSPESETGHVKEQRLKLAGELQFTPVTVRFYHPVATFILEGDKRHPTQAIAWNPSSF